jgi:hypothetical protein
MGPQGTGSLEHGDSSGDTFWIKYPEPFLEYYYDTYPDKLPKANDQTPAAASPVPTVAAEPPLEHIKERYYQKFSKSGKCVEDIDQSLGLVADNEGERA